MKIVCYIVTGVSVIVCLTFFISCAPSSTGVTIMGSKSPITNITPAFTAVTTVASVTPLPTPPTTLPTTTLATTERPIEVVSMELGVPPINPGGPNWRLTLKNIGDKPVTYLVATVNDIGPTNTPTIGIMPTSMSFYFGDLSPGAAASQTRTLVGPQWNVQNGKIYPLTITGVQNGYRFDYTISLRL